MKYDVPVGRTPLDDQPSGPVGTAESVRLVRGILKSLKP
jgi:hypothetical protein